MRHDDGSVERERLCLHDDRTRSTAEFFGKVASKYPAIGIPYLSFAAFCHGPLYLDYQWKKGGTWLPINEYLVQNQWFPFASMTGGPINLATAAHSLVLCISALDKLGLVLVGIHYSDRDIRLPASEETTDALCQKQTWSLFLMESALFLLPLSHPPYLGYQGFF